MTISHILGYGIRPTLRYSNKSRTLPFENRKNITAIALSPDSNVLITVDEGQARGIDLVSLKPSTNLFQMVASCSLTSREVWCYTTSTFTTPSGRYSSLQMEGEQEPHSPAHAASADPGLFRRYIAVTRETHVQVWRAPNYLLREFAPFNLHRTYTGHHDEVLSLEWSPDSKYVNCW